MMTEPVSVPTSGTSENRNARNASTAGNGAWMIDRKMKLATPLPAPASLPEHVAAHRLGDLLGEVGEPRRGGHQLVVARFMR